VEQLRFQFKTKMGRRLTPQSSLRRFLPAQGIHRL